MIDVLTDWITVVRAHGVLLARSGMPRRWGFKMDARPATTFHWMARGSGFLLREGAAPLAVGEGDFVVLPRGDAHALVSDRSFAPLALEDAIPRWRSTRPSEIEARVLCGEYVSDARLEGGLWHTMPDVALFSRAEIREHAALLELLERELEGTRAGGEALIRHLLDALFVYLFRARGARCGEGSCASGLRDPALAKALRAIHSQPARPWTVASLAKVASLSRAAFARRFHEALGEPPVEYLTRWRMTVASRLLADTELGIAEIAARVGYTSEFAFSRAFKRARSLAPTPYRRELRAEAGLRAGL